MLVSAPLLIFFLRIAMNWPQLLLFVIDLNLAMHSNRIAIEYRRPRIAGARPHLHGFANDRQQFDRIHKQIHLSTCASITDLFNNNDTITANATQLRATLIFNWTMTINSDHHHYVTSGNECSIDWKAPVEGEYRIRVHIYSNLLPHKLLMSGARSIVVRDLWIVALGDSFASGEGNPELPMQGMTPAHWLSDACHRSSHAWTYKTYEMIAEKYSNYGIIFTFLACTGASIDNGVLTIAGDNNHRSQFDMIVELRAGRRRSPDLVLVSVGGNDVGYADILNDDASFDDIDMRFFYLSHQLDRLADAFAERLQLPSTSVIFPHYFDPTRNERGMIDADCDDLQSIGSEQLAFAEQHILRRINTMISNRANRWTPVDGVTRIFEHSGLCSKQPMIVSIRESERRQGNAMGAYHPIAEAHSKIARLVWMHIDTMFD